MSDKPNWLKATKTVGGMPVRGLKARPENWRIVGGERLVKVGEVACKWVGAHWYNGSFGDAPSSYDLDPLSITEPEPVCDCGRAEPGETHWEDCPKYGAPAKPEAVCDSDCRECGLPPNGHNQDCILGRAPAKPISCDLCAGTGTIVDEWGVNCGPCHRPGHAPAKPVVFPTEVKMKDCWCPGNLKEHRPDCAKPVVKVGQRWAQGEGGTEFTVSCIEDGWACDKYGLFMHLKSDGTPLYPEWTLVSEAPNAATKAAMAEPDCAGGYDCACLHHPMPAEAAWKPEVGKGAQYGRNLVQVRGFSSDGKRVVFEAESGEILATPLANLTAPAPKTREVVKLAWLKTNGDGKVWLSGSEVVVYEGHRVLAGPVSVTFPGVPVDDKDGK